MTEETRLAVREMNLQDTLTLGETLARSGYFSDAKQTAQAVVKILAGRELGLGPIASMGGINIVQGHPTIGANAIATLVQAHPVYGYRVKTHTEERCEILFYEIGQEKPIGCSIFTMADAAKAGLAGKPVWKQYPRNMLFARAMSNGARWYCPAVFSGVPIYIPEELGAEVNGDGDIIDVSPTPVPDEQPEPEPEPQTNGRPYTAERLQEGMRIKAGWVDGQRLDSEPITDKQIPFVASLMTHAAVNLPDDLKDKARYDVLNYLFGVTSTKALTKREASTVIDWLSDKRNAAHVCKEGEIEFGRIIEAVAVDQGQMTMEMVL